MKRFLSCIYIILFFVTCSKVGAQNSHLILLREDTLHSAILNQERNILVFLPRDYDKNKAYPVVYVLDGNEHTLFTGAAIDELARTGLVPQMIVVGIPNIDRTKDLTPTHRSNFNGHNDPGLSTSGGGNNFLDFITKELFQYIDSAYSTMPYRILIRHSFGGLLATHALFSMSNKFNGYIAIDPTLLWDNNYVVNNVPKISYSFKNKIYISSAMDSTLAIDPDNI